MVTKCCSVCYKPETPTTKSKVCGKCKEVRYCSAECQKIAWGTHKLVCVKKMVEHEAAKATKKITKGLSTEPRHVTKMLSRADRELHRQIQNNSFDPAYFSELVKDAKKQEERLGKMMASIQRSIDKIELAKDHPT